MSEALHEKIVLPREGPRNADHVGRQAIEAAVGGAQIDGLGHTGQPGPFGVEVKQVRLAELPDLARLRRNAHRAVIFPIPPEVFTIGIPTVAAMVGGGITNWLRGSFKERRAEKVRQESAKTAREQFISEVGTARRSFDEYRAGFDPDDDAVAVAEIDKKFKDAVDLVGSYNHVGDLRYLVRGGQEAADAYVEQAKIDVDNMADNRAECQTLVARATELQQSLQTAGWNLNLKEMRLARIITDVATASQQADGTWTHPHTEQIKRYQLQPARVFRESAEALKTLVDKLEYVSLNGSSVHNELEINADNYKELTVSVAAAQLLAESLPKTYHAKCVGDLDPPKNLDSEMAQLHKKLEKMAEIRDSRNPTELADAEVMDREFDERVARIQAWCDTVTNTQVTLETLKSTLDQDIKTLERPLSELAAFAKEHERSIGSGSALAAEQGHATIQAITAAMKLKKPNYISIKKRVDKLKLYQEDALARMQREIEETPQLAQLVPSLHAEILARRKALLNEVQRRDETGRGRSYPYIDRNQVTAITVAEKITDAAELTRADIDRLLEQLDNCNTEYGKLESQFGTQKAPEEGSALKRHLDRKALIADIT